MGASGLAQREWAPRVQSSKTLSHLRCLFQLFANPFPASSLRRGLGNHARGGLG